MSDPNSTLQRLRALLEEGEQFTYDNFSYKSRYGYPESFSAPYIAWYTRARNIMHRAFAADSAPLRMLDSGLAVQVFGNGEDKFEQMRDAILSAMESAVAILEDDRFGELSTANAAPSESGATPSNRVFIVHGHDEVAKMSLEVFLQEIGLEPIVLHRQADEGQTIIEKFERYSDVGYAFVLLTPDEIAYVASQEPLEDGMRVKEWRARPNVIFEFGFFVGRLGRSRVCCLYRSPVALPSDISGLLYKKFEQTVEEVGYAIIKELRAVGYTLRV